MPDSYDVVIVGGAAMGSSVAYHLARRSGLSRPGARHREGPDLRRSASALSAASIRQQFSSAVNIRISLFGIRVPARGSGSASRSTASGRTIALREGGYLYLASAAGAAVLDENHALQSVEGADIELFDASSAPRPLLLAQRGGPRLRHLGPLR